MAPPSYTNGRRGPNVTHFLRELNTIGDKPQDELRFEEDLTAFTNTNFFDFDAGQNMDYQASPVKPELESAIPSSAATTTDELTPHLNDLGNIDFMSSGDFNFGDFSTYHGSGVPPFHESLGNLQPLQPTPQAHYSSSMPHQQPQQNAYVQTTPAPTPVSTGAESAVAKVSDLLRKNSRPSLNFEEHSRMAAEEDKRRRNTAASARFRIKKKQREQALEQSHKDMADKVTALESRINLLETENRWLKNLVMEKNDNNEEIIAMFKEFDSKHKASKTLTESTRSSESFRGDDE